MIVDKVKLIIENIIFSTNSGDLSWSENSSPDKRHYLRTYSTLGEDGTKYEVEIKFIINAKGLWQLEENASMFIKNPKLPNGIHYAYGGQSELKEVLSEFRKVLMLKYCQDMRPSEKIIEDVLEDIAKGVNLSNYRENKLNKVLNNN